ncbi:MAG: Xaa-Pro aminopeptidase [Planctomycetota bacterium]|nr:MAG: Xaa-Pro aminopeptidase [Planctomycetota bacterium]
MAIPKLAPCVALLIGVSCAHPSYHDGSELRGAPGLWEWRPRAVAPELPEPPSTLVAECRERRERLAAAVGGPSAVWLEAAGTDGEGQFFQSDDFYYFTGTEDADIGLLLQVDAAGRLVKETLFLPPHDPNWEAWNGPRLSPGDAAEAATGIRDSAELGELGAHLEALDVPVIHTLDGLDESPEHLEVKARERGAPLRGAINRLRLVKSAYEIQCLRNSINITTAAMRTAAVEIQDGGTEFALQGAIEGSYLRFGSERRGFASICAAGGNAVTLHYSDNVDTLDDGELVLMDIGSKYRYYCADVTRTLPVNGRFSPRQRELYELVLAAQKHAEERVQAGMTLQEMHQLAVEYFEDAGYRKYFTHGLGHWIGLDVHDVGRGLPIEVGSLFTIEPGLYIEAEGIGIRIEDDYLMTEDGPVRLSTGFPREVAEIEAFLEALH